MEPGCPAFNEGCDARLAGKLLTENPYPEESAEARTWVMGWKDVNSFWGKDVHRRTFRPLPSLRRKEAS